MGHYLEGRSTSPRVMIPATRAFHQAARSGAHGFRSHRLRSLLMVCKYRRIRVTLVLIKDCVGFLWMAADALLGNQKELRSTGTNGLAGC
jgi:hypothetical protein